MTRAFTEAVAALADHLRGGVPTLVFLTLLVALLVGLAWYFWPRWLPWNWRWRWGSGGSRRSRRTGWRGRFRLGSWRWRWRLRLRWRRRRKGEPDHDADLPADELPDLPAEMLVLTADQLAAAGRFKEAVRERLRAMIRELIEKGIIPFSPGWTVTELAAAASRARPALTPPLGAAVSVFSEIWYGLRPASFEDDAAMRTHAATLTQTLNDRAPVGS